jgi:hypothetical protein
MIWRRNGRERWWASRLALFALLLQAVMPALHHPAGMVIAGSTRIEVGLCLAPGSMVPGDPAKAPAHHVPLCAFCAAMHAVGGFLPPIAPTIAVSRRYDAVSSIVSTGLVPRQALHPRQQPRAPPTLA